MNNPEGVTYCSPALPALGRLHGSSQSRKGRRPARKLEYVFSPVDHARQRMRIRAPIQSPLRKLFRKQALCQGTDSSVP
jgi:hypothetical protein